MKSERLNSPILVENKSLKVVGGLIKTAQLQDEYYDSIENPSDFIKKVAASGLKADLFTFLQDVENRVPKHPFQLEWDSMAVLPLTTYETWLNTQINFKPRNKIRKAQKSGVETRVVEFNDELVRAIMEIYNETPIRQGKRNWHYGKDFETLKREHQTFLDKSEFIGAFFKGELIGFAKIVHLKNHSMFMNIVARISHRDKAPTNAIIAKSVEICAARNAKHLTFGVWGRRGLNELKVANGFELCQVPRYYVPLTLKGRLLLGLRLHRSLKSYMPEWCIVAAAELRSKWNERKHRNRIPKPGSGALGAKAP
jgi:hypothetical protein